MVVNYSYKREGYFPKTEFVCPTPKLKKTMRMHRLLVQLRSQISCCNFTYNIWSHNMIFMKGLWMSIECLFNVFQKRMFETRIMDKIFSDFLILYQIFFTPHVKRSVIISNKHGMYELPHELPNDLRLRILGN